MKDYSNSYGYLVKGKARSPYEAWLDPDGNWYNMYHLGDHQVFAYEVVKANYPMPDSEWIKDLDRIEKSNDILLKDGWIFIQGWWGDIILRGYQHMKAKQYRALHAVLGDTRLFRGWTVRSLYLCKEDAKEDAKTD